MRFFILIFFLLFFINSNTFSQIVFEENKDTIFVEKISVDSILIEISELNSNKIYTPNSSVTKLPLNTLNDAGSTIASPFRWTKEEWITTSLLTSGIVGSMFLDTSVKKYSQSIRTENSNIVSEHIEKIGDSGYLLVGLAGTYLTSLFIDNDYLESASLTAVEGIVITSIFTTIGKFAFLRDRPFIAADNLQFRTEPYGGKSQLSFPSGHTGSAFVVATVFAEAYKDIYPVVPYIAYTTATLVGLSRIHDNRHWLSDVIAGATIGYSVGKFISKRRLEDRTNLPNIGMSVREGMFAQKETVFTVALNF